MRRMAGCLGKALGAIAHVRARVRARAHEDQSPISDQHSSHANMPLSARFSLMAILGLVGLPVVLRGVSWWMIVGNMAYASSVM